MSDLKEREVESRHENCYLFAYAGVFAGERERYRLGVCVSRDLFLGTPFICLCGHGIERISRV